MDVHEVIMRSTRQERGRIAFLCDTRGDEAAKVFARQTLAIYRSAVVQRSAPAGEPVFRLRLIGSYCYLKRYLAGSVPAPVESHGR